MKRIGVVGLADGWSSQQLVGAFEKLGVSAPLIEMDRVAVDLTTGDARHGDVDLRACDAIVLRKIGSPYSPDMLDRLSTLGYLAATGLPCYSDPMRVKLVLDRLSCTITLRAAGIPMPPTTITESIEEADAAVSRYGKAVFKPLYTSKARGMEVIEAGKDAHRLIADFKATGNQVMYLQKLMKLPGRDLGLVFLGGEFLGCYARVGDDASWNTTTHSGGKYAPHDPPGDVIDLAHRAQSPFKLDFTCVDVAMTDEGPVVFEVSAFGGFRGLWEGRRIDAAAKYAEYVLDRVEHGR